MMSRTTLILIMTLLVVGPEVQAQSSTSAFTRCSRVANDARRLSCYDRLAADLIELGMSAMESPEVMPNPVAPTNATETMALPAEKTTVPEQAQPEAEASPKSPEVVASATTPQPESSTSEGEFGMERTEARQATELKKIRSRYVGEFRGWDGDTEFPLENGQIWKQIRSGRVAWRADSPMITIDRKGFMGAYRLSVEGINSKVIVKRIK